MGFPEYETRSRHSGTYAFFYGDERCAYRAKSPRKHGYVTMCASSANEYKTESGCRRGEREGLTRAYGLACRIAGVVALDAILAGSGYCSSWESSVTSILALTATWSRL